MQIARDVGFNRSFIRATLVTMTRWAVVCGCLMLVGVGESPADPVPTSLRMRPRGTPRERPVHVADDGLFPPRSRLAPQTTAPAEQAPQQDNVTTTPELTDEDLAMLAEVEADEEVIVITGSTLDRRELTTPAAVSVLDRADLEAAGVTTLGEIIQNLPAQSNGLNATYNNGGNGATRINMRGLGDKRTLILIDGRRLVNVGIGADTSFDINTLPLAVIERIEVLKDGASAVYGSDAIGGVVNVITRQDFTGTLATVYTGTSQYGDAINYDTSFVTGFSTDKSNVMVSAGWQSQSSVLSGDRDWAKFDRSYDFTEPDPSMRIGIGGSTASPAGRLNPASVDYDGDGLPDNSTALCGAAACKPDGSGGWLPYTADDNYNFRPPNYLYTPSRRYNVFAQADYKISGQTRAFFQALFVDRQSSQQLAPLPVGVGVNPAISAQSIYNPLGGTIYDYRRRMVELGNRTQHQRIDTARIVTGVRGKIADDADLFAGWKWELSYNYGHSAATEYRRGNLIRSRLAAAVGPSFIDTDGTAKCGTPGNVIPGCVPINLLGPAGSVTAEQRDYISYRAIYDGGNDQKTVLALAGGRITALPNGGDLSLAVGADYRTEAATLSVDPIAALGDSSDAGYAPAAGKYSVFEAFSELSLVPISGHEIAEWTEISLAARGFRYDTFGSGVTWKAGGLFKAKGGIAVRGTYSTAFRAPSVIELFKAAEEGFNRASDPCDTDVDLDGTSDGPLADPVAARRCAEQGVAADAVFGTQQQRGFSAGNRGLGAETANVITAGVVYEPPSVPGLALVADYFRIQIDNAIQNLGTNVILADCYGRDVSSACALIHRNPQRNYEIDYIDDGLVNVGGAFTDGIDLAATYDHRAKEHHFRHQVEGQILRTYQLETASQVLEGVGYYDLGVFPRAKVNVMSLWERNELNAGVSGHYVASLKECHENDCNTPVNRARYARDIGSYLTMSVFAGCVLKSRAGTTRATIGVNNVFNTNPRTIYNSESAYADSDGSVDNMIGRYFYLRMSQQF